MIETADPSTPRELRARRTTSSAAWAVVLAVAAALLAVRIPRFAEAAEVAVGSAAAELADPQLAATAIAVGTVSAVAIHLLLLVVMAGVAALLERFLGPRAIGGRLRFGVAGVAYGAIVLGQQVAALAGGVASIERSWPLWLAAVGVGLAAPALFREARSSAAAYGRAAIAAVATGVLLCVG